MVSRLFALPPTPPRREYHYLVVSHGLRFSQAEDSDVLKVRGEDLAAFLDVYRRNHEDQNTASF
jgi:hypothetical protein